MMKRIFDILVSGTVLLILLPLFIVVAVAIKVDSPGSVIYRQKRIGRRCKPFEIYKFRSMVSNADRIGGFSTMEGDTRVTPVGRFIRRTSIDELPQLLNVLKGDMSLVGPRPDVPAQQSNYAVDDWSRRHSVRPGITGLAQATARSVATPEERTQLDLKYVDSVSLATDLRIIALTARQVARRSAY